MKGISDEMSNIYNKLIHQTLIPLLLMVITPHIALILPYIIVARNGNFCEIFAQQSLKSILLEAWKSVNWYDLECWCLVIALIFYGIISLNFPGKKFYGPLTSNGFRPEYRDTGFRFYIIFLSLTVTIIYRFSVLHFYYKIPTLMGILVIFGIVFCLLLYIKGLVIPDHGICDITGNPIFDYYWGVEMYPKLGNINLKLLFNCRFGLILWQLIALIAWKSDYELNIDAYNRGEINWPLTASTLLQTIYLAKYYYFEAGYVWTIDMCVDRYGYYLAFGCIAFVPSILTLQSLYLVAHSPTEYFGLFSFIISMIVGTLFIGLTYWADQQRVTARDTNGKCDIWGKPAKVIRATYVDDSGVSQRSILLCSGFWGIARHFNYTVELMSVFLYCLPALFSSVIPYFYLIILLVLMLHRIRRDNDKCSKKYGKYWDEYCERVPYKMLPYIF